MWGKKNPICPTCITTAFRLLAPSLKVWVPGPSEAPWPKQCPFPMWSSGGCTRGSTRLNHQSSQIRITSWGDGGLGLHIPSDGSLGVQGLSQGSSTDWVAISSNNQVMGLMFTGLFLNTHTLVSADIIWYSGIPPPPNLQGFRFQAPHPADAKTEDLGRLHGSLCAPLTGSKVLPLNMRLVSSSVWAAWLHVLL